MLRTVALAGSIAAAARALHITPPAVSQQLGQLEREAGTALLHRSRQGVTLTVAGQRLAMRAERIEQELLGARRDLAEFTGNTHGRVRFAAFQSVMESLVVPALRIAAADDPGVQLEFTEGYGPAVTAQLRAGELDAAIVEHDHAAPPRQPQGIAHVPLMLDAYRIVVPASWHTRVRTLEDLEGRAWVAGPPGTACDVALRRVLDRLTAPGEVHDVCTEFATVLTLVAAGRGAAVIPLLALPRAGVVIIDHIDIGARDILIAHRRTRAGVEPPVQAAIRAFARAATTARAQISTRPAPMP